MCLKNEKQPYRLKGSEAYQSFFLSPKRGKKERLPEGQDIESISHLSVPVKGLILSNVFTTNVYCERIRQILITTKCYFH